MVDKLMLDSMRGKIDQAADLLKLWKQILGWQRESPLKQLLTFENSLQLLDPQSDLRQKSRSLMERIKSGQPYTAEDLQTAREFLDTLSRKEQEGADAVRASDQTAAVASVTPSLDQLWASVAWWVVEVKKEFAWLKNRFTGFSKSNPLWTLWLMSVLSSKSPELGQFVQERIYTDPSLTRAMWDKLNSPRIPGWVHDKVAAIDEKAKPLIAKTKNIMSVVMWFLFSWFAPKELQQLADEMVAWYEKVPAHLRNEQFFAQLMSPDQLAWMAQNLAPVIVDQVRPNPTHKPAHPTDPKASETVVPQTQDNVVDKKLAEIKTSAMKFTQRKFEEAFDKKFDDATFQRVYEAWSTKYDVWNKMKQNIDAISDAVTWKWPGVNVMTMFVDMLSLPWVASVDLLSMLVDAKLLSWTEVSLVVPKNGVGDAIDVWVQWVWLFGAWIGYIFGSVTYEELQAFIQSNSARFENMTETEKMAFLWLLHRHWSLFASIAGALGTLTWYALSLPFQVGEDVSKIAVFFSTWKGSMDKQIALWNNLATALKLPEAQIQHISTMLEDLTKATQLSSILNQSSSAADFVQKATTAWLADELNKLWIADEAWDFVKFKDIMHGRVWATISTLANTLEASFGPWKRLIGSHVNWLYLYAGQIDDSVQFLKKYAALYQSANSESEIFRTIRQVFGKFRFSLHASEIIDRTQEARFYLNSAAEGKQLANDMSYLAKKLPQGLWHMFSHVSIIVAWVNIADELKKPDWEWSDAVRSLAAVFVPYYGWLSLMSDGITVGEGWIINAASFTSWLFLTWLETAFLIKDVTQQWVLRWVGAFVARPTVTTYKALVALPSAAVDAVVLTRNTGLALTSIRSRAQLWAMISPFANPRTAMIALAILGGAAVWNNMHSDQNPQLAAIMDQYKQDPNQLDKELKKDWKTLPTAEQTAVLQAAFLLNLWADITPENLDKVAVWQPAPGKFNAKIDPTLYMSVVDSNDTETRRALQQQFLNWPLFQNSAWRIKDFLETVA